MKDRLEDFVRQNREEFDVREPDPSLWLRINPQNTPVRKDRRLRWIRYAAAAAVLFAGISAGIYFISGTGTAEKNLYGSLYREIIEAEAYYTSMFDQKYNELKPYISDSPEIQEELNYDLNELDQIYAELREDLKDNVGNPEVLEAMIQQYRTKVEILEDLLNQLKEKENKDYEESKEVSL
jgi:hypothetical protein